MEYFFRQKDEYFGKTTSVTTRFETDYIEEAVTKYREFLLGCGFARELVDAYIPDPDADEKDCCPSHDKPDSEGGEE